LCENLLKLRSFKELPVSTKIARNAAFSGLRVLLVAPIPLLLTPFILHRVGALGLGIWAVFVSINNLTSLADLGILGTLTRHVSEHFTKKDYVQLNRTLNSGLIMFLGIAAFCVCVVTLGSSLVTALFFRRAPVTLVELHHAVRWLAVAIGLNLVAFPFTSITTGLQRLDATNLLAAWNLALTALLVALFLAGGLGIMGFAYAIVISAAVNLALQIGVARKLLPEFKPALEFVHKADIRALFSFSLQMYLTQIAIAVHANTEKLLLAVFSGLPAAGWYEIANDLSAKMRSLPSLLLTPLLPAVTELEARQDQPRQMELYYRTHKYLAFVGVPLAVLAGLLARRFVALWLGPGFSAAATALAILASVHLFNLTCAPAGLIFIGKGMLKPGVRSALYGIISNLLVSTVLIIRLGFNGAVYGTSFAVVTATLYLLFMFHRETHYPVLRLCNTYVKPLSCAGALAPFFYYVIHSRQSRWLDLIVISTIFMASYGAGLVLLRYFDAFDLEALERIVRLPKLLHRIVLLAR